MKISKGFKIACYVIAFAFFIYTYNLSQEAPAPEQAGNFKVTAVLVKASDYSELGVNLPELNNIDRDVISTSQKYFKGINFTGFNEIYTNESYMGSSYIIADKNIIIGLGGNITNETYRYVFTHEYAHYLLYGENLSSMRLQEGLAETYATFLNRDMAKKEWGNNSERRVFPYNIFITPILENNKFNCLYGVFDEYNKISDVNQILDRLDKFCGVTYNESQKSSIQ